jgi:carboxymethylenebutenolidase
MQLITPAGEMFDTYVVGDENATKGILIIHDWWGLLAYNCEWADEFAKLGYRAMVIDLYEGHHPKDMKAAGSYMQNIDQARTNRKLKTALQSLQATDRKVAILGWSFGGLQAQHATLHFPELVHALVFFYCRVLLDHHNVKAMNAPTLAIFAETELTWPDKQAALEDVMAENGKILECYSYDADHGFAHPDSLRYDADATEDAWQMTINFLNKYLT